MANSNLSTYDFHKSNIRVITSENGEILFCLKDVCSTLQLSNINHVINQLKEEFEGVTLNVTPFKTQGGTQNVTFITEPQLYFVMMRSRAKVAREFRQWICNEVLPSIRAHGTYTQKKEQPKQKRCWYVEEIKNLSDKNKLSDELFVAFVDIANRAFKQGYAIAVNKGNPQAHLNTQEQIESGQVRGVLMTERQAAAVDHILYNHQMFKPELLDLYDKISDIQEQAQKLFWALRDIQKSKLYDAATESDFSVDVLLKNKKKNELVTRN